MVDVAVEVCLVLGTVAVVVVVDGIVVVDDDVVVVDDDSTVDGVVREMNTDDDDVTGMCALVVDVTVSVVLLERAAAFEVVGCCVLTANTLRDICSMRLTMPRITLLMLLLLPNNTL